MISRRKVSPKTTPAAVARTPRRNRIAISHRPAARRRGGAGGAQSVPPGARGDSPDDRLDAAIDNIRAAQNRRLPEDEPPASANDDRKDW